MAEYIEREHLLKLAKDIADMYSSTGLAAPKIIKLIERMKKADVVEVKHGEWVKAAAYNDGIFNTVKCSICETFQPIGEWDWQAYCPNCGAKMDKKEGAEE